MIDIIMYKDQKENLQVINQIDLIYYNEICYLDNSLKNDISGSQDSDTLHTMFIIHVSLHVITYT